MITEHIEAVLAQARYEMRRLGFEGPYRGGEHPYARPYPSCLVLGWLISGDPLHIVCSRGDVEPALRIVTVYEPEDALWESDYKTRKR